jgi:hypothetical protein
MKIAGRCIILWCVFLMVIASLILIACAGKYEYSKPPSPAPLENTVTVNKSKDEVWKKIVPALGKHFFVINNLDKDSGIINVSYKGDPEKYVDCGRITSYVKNVRGERTYDFPAAKAYQEYEVMKNGKLFGVKRSIDLEGRMNIIVEAISANQTRITVNTRYILTGKAVAVDTQGQSASETHTISFNSGQQAAFPGGTTCQSNGNLEKEVISLMLDKP